MVLIIEDKWTASILLLTEVCKMFLLFEVEQVFLSVYMDKLHMSILPM